MNRKAQVSIFIIIAIVVVAGVIIFFSLREIGPAKVPASLEPVYVNFLGCLEEDIKTGIDVLGSQGGYIELPEFEPGSGHMPFSSQLEFVGNQIPYWYYVSGNNIQKDQVPSLSDMETALEDFVESQIVNCPFDIY